MAKTKKAGAKKKAKGKKATKASAKRPPAEKPEASTPVAAKPASEKPVPDSIAVGLRQLLRRTERLDPSAHGDLKVLSGRDFSFASGLHTIPLSAIEFMPSARHYPIIFAGDEDLQPIAMLGLRPGENLFVEPNGSWREGCYVPAILRRAPFVLMQDSKGGQDGVGLCLDVESPLVSKTDGAPLFKDGKPTSIVAKMATFAASFSKEQSRTQLFVQACMKHELLVERQMEITLATGQKVAFRGFRVIDEDRMRKLPDAAALDFYRRGWSALAVAHFLSLGNMGRLHHAANRRVAA